MNPDQYWDRPLQLTGGCTPVSPGCLHCWSAAGAYIRQYQKNPKIREQYKGLTYPRDGIPTFDGTIRTFPNRLDIPLKRKKPTVYAVWNDLGHEDVSIKFFRDAYEIMSRCPQHTFLVLTKRAEHITERLSGDIGRPSPLDHVWHGLTICNQKEWDEKKKYFSLIPGKKFLSIEPMLGAIVLELMKTIKEPFFGWPDSEMEYKRKIDAVILGGETGPGARPMHPDWVRSIRDQCQSAGVPFFFKGWGKWCPDDYATVLPSGAAPKRISVKTDGSYTDHAEAYAVDMMRVKSRLLDGKEWNNLPWR